MSRDDGYKVYFSGEEGRHEYGVGFLVHKDIVSAVFYHQLQETIDQTPQKDILVVQRDWNAKVGKGSQADWGEVCGPYCNIETNERSLRLLEFATFNNLVLTNTLGPNKPSRRWTWHSSDGKHRN